MGKKDDISGGSLPSLDGPGHGGISRRTLVKGGAWAAPVIMLAAAAPAQAASQNCAQQGGVFKAQAAYANIGAANALPAVAATVPAGANKMHFVVIGGGGGDGDAAYGRPARIEGDILVTPGQTYYLLAGAGGNGVKTYAMGGGSLYGSGGDGGDNKVSQNGAGGGGASALLLGSATPGVGTEIAVAGGGGGSNVNGYPRANPDNASEDAKYSSTFVTERTATSNTTVTVPGGTADAGLPAGAGTSAAGQVGDTGWMGARPNSSVAPTSSQIVLMSGGGIGAGAGLNSPGAGGQVKWVAGPVFGNTWTVNGKPGSGHVGGHGADSPAKGSGALSGGGGGGYSGGGGGGVAQAQWNYPPAPYAGPYGIAGGGGGGSSFVTGSAFGVAASLVPQSGGYGTMGSVEVTFFAC